MTIQEPQGRETERVTLSIDKDVVEFLDEQAAKLDRSRSWMFMVLGRRYKQSLERAAERRAKQKAAKARQAG